MFNYYSSFFWIKETESIIDKCFEKFKSVELNSTNDQDFVKKIQNIIQEEAQSSDNPYFKMLVNKL